MNLKEFKEKRNLTWEELSELTGVNKNTLLAIHQGNRNNPTIEIVEKIYQATGLVYREYIKEVKSDEDNLEKIEERQDHINDLMEDKN